MDRKRIITLAVLLASAVSAFALDLSGTGLKAAGTAREGLRTVVTLKDPMDRTVQISYLAEPDGRTFAKIVELKGTFSAWQTIDVSSMRFTVTGANLEAALVLDRLVLGGKDISENVPAGLFFTWTGILEYDFRMVKDNVFLRIRGPFSAEKELTDKMLSAVANPVAFLQRSDPEYYIPKVEKLETDVPALQKLVQALSQRVASMEAADRAASLRTDDLEVLTESLRSRQAVAEDGIVQLRATQESLTEAGGLLESRLESLKNREGELEADLAAKEADLLEQLAAMVKKDGELARKDEETVQLIGDRTSSLAAGAEKLRGEAEKLRGEFEALRYAVMTFHDVEWLFWQVPVPKDGLARTLELKAANPAWGLKELAPALRDAGLKITDQQINLILSVYCNEFPK